MAGPPSFFAWRPRTERITAASTSRSVSDVVSGRGAKRAREVSAIVPALTSWNRQPSYLPADQLPILGLPSLSGLSDEKQEQVVTEVLFGACFSAIHALSVAILKLNGRLRQRKISQARILSFCELGKLWVSAQGLEYLLVRSL